MVKGNGQVASEVSFVLLVGGNGRKQTTRVTRYFDNATRLQDAFDYDTGTTSYLYDDNGNLTLIIPPGGAEWLHYGFDQRNLMISHTVSISGTNLQEMAAFVYDGNGDRVQQIDSSGGQPVTTTYINDVVGLTQVLVADDGTEQVYNLFGLDLIGQDEGASTRYLLADGLGSVRTEMVDGTVESVTTYDPYGNLLQQTGDTGTTYGYTGEQQDSSTGLLYLRARYYNPALRSFMGRDPWSGNGKRPQSMNGWSYVENNSINRVDPSGLSPSSSALECGKTSVDKRSYIDCVTDAYNVDSPYDPFYSQFEITVLGMDDFDVTESGYVDEEYKQVPLSTITGTPNCYSGPVPYRAKGYTEGFLKVKMALWWGQEIVYDFATMERAIFDFEGSGVTGSFIFNWGYTEYTGVVNGFRSWSGNNIETDYGGTAKGYAGGLAIFLSKGYGYSYGHWDRSINVRYSYYGIGFSPDIGLGLDVAAAEPGLLYDMTSREEYVISPGKIRKGDLVMDILLGHGSFGPYSNTAKLMAANRGVSAGRALWHAWVYENMYKTFGSRA